MSVSASAAPASIESAEPPASPPSVGSSAPPAPRAEPPAEVMLGDSVAFVLRARAGDSSASDRAKTAGRTLRDAFDASPDAEVHVERSHDVAVIYLGTAPIVQLGVADAAAAGDASLEVHADAVAAQLRKAIQAEKARSRLASRIFSISLVVFFGMVVLYLLRRIGDLAERANTWVEDNPHRFSALRFQTFTILTPAAFRSAVALAISVARWVGQFAIVYVWLLAALGLFETTRGYTDKLNAYLLGPFVSLTSRIAGMLPITVVVCIAALVTAIVLRVMGLFFESVRSGATTIEWLPPDLARPTSIIARASLVLVMVLFAAPVLTGHPDGALARAGLVGLVSLGVAAVPLMACASVGMFVVFGRTFQVGEFVRIGRHHGRVVDVGLMDVSLENDAGLSTRIPHLVTLLQPIEHLGDLPRIAVKLSVPRSRVSSALRTRIARAVVAVGSEPRVEVDELGLSEATLTVSVLSEDQDAKSRLLLLALEASEEGSEAAPP